MRRSLIFLVRACAVLALIAPPVHAQVRTNEEAAVIAAAVSHMVHLLRANHGVPPGQVRFDPRVLEGRQIQNPAHSGYATIYELGGLRPDSVSAAATGLMAAEIGNFDDARVCATESLRSCTLRDAVALFASGTPTIGADSAELVVQAMWLGDLAKQPVQDGIFHVTLRRDGSGWKAIATRTLRIS
jgi:hypothetical protein